MDRHTCKPCFRLFHNGRALGGHMRSHVMAATAATAYSPPVSFASTSSTEVDDGKPTQREPVSRVIRDSSRKCFIKVGAPEFSSGGAVGGGSSVVQDGHSDTESCLRFAVSRRRSKRARRRAPPAVPDPEPASSVSDATPEEDVAMSLVILSRDSWTRSRSKHEHRWAPASSEREQNNDNASLFGEDGYDNVAVATTALRLRPRSRFQCGACKKVFRSYQALGGHRASIKKGKGGCVPVPPLPTPTKAHCADVIHECPYCFRVFDSGQALGGHKRAHMMVSACASPSPAKCGDSSGSMSNCPSISTCRPRRATNSSYPPCTTRSLAAPLDSEIAT